MRRRDFLKTTVILTAGLSLNGVDIFAAETKKNLLPKKNTRVVVIGGGYGGATAAKYLKMIEPKLEIVLINEKNTYISCPMSNHVIVGLDNIKSITLNYRILESKYGIKFFQKTVTDIDGNSKKVYFADGYLDYDYLVVSPGIGFIYDESKGFTKEVVSKYPHGWKAGEQTLMLANMLKNLPKGGNVLLRVPIAPYRCPPGPYERASLIGWYLKKNKPGSKIFVLDANDDVVSKGKLFKEAWADLYKGGLEYIPDVDIMGIDSAKNTLKTSKGDIKGELINFIPDQKANDTAFKFGLVPEGKLWVPVDGFTFESTLIKNVHVLGDSTNTGTVGPMPKSAFVANSMGKAVAETIAAIVNGKTLPKPFLSNACYSMVSGDEAIWITGVYEYDPEKKLSVQVGKAGGTPSSRSKIDKEHQLSWAKSIWQDTFM